MASFHRQDCGSSREDRGVGDQVGGAEVGADADQLDEASHCNHFGDGSEHGGKIKGASWDWGTAQSLDCGL